MADTPLVLTPPEHPTPMQRAGFVACWIAGLMLAFSVFTTILRFYFRNLKKTPLGVDDVCIIIALPLEIGYITTVLLAVKNGGGGSSNIITLPYYELSYFLKVSWIGKFFFPSAVTVAKISVIFFYRRIFYVSKPFCKAANIVLVFAVAWWFIAIAVTVGTCRPVNYNWVITSAGPYLPNHCINYPRYYVCIESANTVLDTAILALPILEIRKLQLRRSQKIGLAGIFALGGLVIISGLLRIASYAPGHSKPVMHLEILAMIGTGVDITCANLPCFGPLLVDKLQLASRIGHWYGRQKRSWRMRLGHKHKLPDHSDSGNPEMANVVQEWPARIYAPEVTQSWNDDRKPHFNTRAALEDYPEL